MIQRSRFLLIAVATLVVGSATSISRAATIRVGGGGPLQDLQAAIDDAAPGDTLLIAPGRYSAVPASRIDSLCGNCQKHLTSVPFTAGFHIQGKSVHLIGESRDSTILVTGAGYGVFFDNAGSGTLANLTVTGAKRDTSGAATDAGVVARGTELTIRDCTILDNNDRAENVIVGVAGIVGREGAGLVVDRCRIENNSWDGIALYRGARALIRDNTIVKGRGVGIGITWDAVAEVYRNDISGYWKGIGTFGTARAVLRDNIVHDVLGWGIVATGSSYLDCVNNIIARTGNCGFSVWSEECRGRFINNVIYAPGWKDEWVCPQVGVWWNGPENAFTATHNIIWDPVAEPWRKSVWTEGSDEPANTSIPADSTLAGRYIVTDPRFVDPEHNNFLPRPGSPLLDAGSPDESDIDGSPSNIGLSTEAIRILQDKPARP